MNYRIGIIGPRRTEMGIGEYTAKYLSSHGAQVKALVASTPESGLQSATHLHEKYGINARVYENAEQMLKSGTIEAIAICTPSATHAPLIELAGKNAVHVFCEKPFIWNTGANNTKKTIELVQRFTATQHIIHCNAQWPYTLQYYEQLHGPIHKENISSFYMRLAPVSSDPWVMIRESAPHANSMLLALGSLGNIENCRITIGRNNPEMEPHVSIVFDSRGTEGQLIQVCYDFIQVAESPRPAYYAINGKFVHRELSLDYQFYFHDNHKNRIDAMDPLELSVQEFLNKILTPEHFDNTTHEAQILANMNMLTSFYEVCNDATN